MLNRRTFLGSVSLCIAALGAGTAAHAQGYPTKPVSLIIPYPAGGPTDLLGRLVAEGLAQKWGQPVVVENKPGASGSLGSDFAARAAADGYTLVLGNNASHGAFELLNPSTVPYKTLENFEPISLIGLAPVIMIVGTHVPATTIQEFIAYAKANPGKINFGSAAVGSSPHFAGELLNIAAGIDMTHVPFNGTAPAIQALLSGSIDTYSGGVSSVMSQVEAGKARALGAIASERLSGAPDVPTMREQGIDMAYDSWFGLLGPKGIPADILDKINADVNALLDGDDNKARLGKLGFERKLGSRADFRTMLEAEIARTDKLIKDAGIEVN